MTAIYRSLSRRPRLVAIAVLGVVVSSIFVGGAQPFAIGLIPAPWDKLVHVFTFATLGAAFAIAAGTRTVAGSLLAAAVAFAIGATDELHQSTLPGRQAGWDDLVADALGALLGPCLAYLIHTTQGKRQPPR